MIVAVLTVRLALPWARSLKDKRSVKRSLCDRIRARFNAAVLESGLQEQHQLLELSVAVLGDSPAQLEALLERVVVWMETATDAAVVSVEKELR